MGLYCIDYQIRGSFLCRQKFPLILDFEMDTLLTVASDEEVRKQFSTWLRLRLREWMVYRLVSFSLSRL